MPCGHICERTVFDWHRKTQAPGGHHYSLARAHEHSGEKIASREQAHRQASVPTFDSLFCWLGYNVTRSKFLPSPLWWTVTRNSNRSMLRPPQSLSLPGCFITATEMKLGQPLDSAWPSKTKAAPRMQALILKLCPLFPSYLIPSGSLWKRRGSKKSTHMFTRS